MKQKSVRTFIAFSRNAAVVALGLGMFAGTMALLFTEHFVLSAIMFILLAASICTFIESTI